ncbi:FAD-binding oxidoreductase [Candidatus Nomurabacteria bacterium]|nr:FAD-binding oxidoreductase [Candidatus Nomurabacteria bacterium]
MFESLQEKLKGDIEYTDEVLQKYSTDWSLFKIMPSAVVYPKDTEDIKALVAWVRQHLESGKWKEGQLSITARAAGTDMTGGPLNHGIIMDVTRYLSGVLEVSRTNEYPNQTSFWGHDYRIAGQATVLPGTFYRDFEPATLAHNLVLPCYPASKALCAVGGMVANNGAGEKSLKYGQNKDFVQELKVVLADGNEYIIKPLSKKELEEKIKQKDFEGNIYKEIWNLVRDNYELIQSKKPQTSKNSSGYFLWDVIQADSLDAFVQGKGYFDMTKLFVGAQGTTGLITEITYKLVEVEKESDLLVVFVDDLDTVPELVEKLMQSDLEMLEMYDDQTFKTGIAFFKDFIKDKGFFGAIKYALRFLPEVWMIVTRWKIPKLIVLAEFVSNDEEGLHIEMQEAFDHIKSLGMRMRQVRHKHGEERFWDFRHDSFKLLTEHTLATRTSGDGTRTAPFIDDIAINPEYLPEYLPKLIDILVEYDLNYTIAGHLGNGNFHVVPLMDMNQQQNRDKIFEVSDRVYDLALSYGASLTAEHNDGIVRTPYIQKMFGSSMTALFAKVKRIFDPNNIFNPGKKVGMTKEDMRKYLA